MSAADSKGITGLPDYQVKKLQKLFDKFDKDGNGSIDRNEIAHLLQSVYRPSREEFKSLLTLFDKNNDGRISEKEFTTIVIELIKRSKNRDCEFSFNPKRVSEVAAKFKELDKDKSGYLDHKELEVLIKHLVPIPRKVLEDFINIFDSDKDGSISFDEFVNMIMKCKGRVDRVIRHRLPDIFPHSQEEDTN
jgi:Ca2+-binding EF-hand superfamily protein